MSASSVASRPCCLGIMVASGASCPSTCHLLLSLFIMRRVHITCRLTCTASPVPPHLFYGERCPRSRVTSVFSPKSHEDHGKPSPPWGEQGHHGLEFFAYEVTEAGHEGDMSCAGSRPAPPGQYTPVIGHPSWQEEHLKNQGRKRRFCLHSLS
ncbi:hypothetical protein E2C01_065607 [Portunus trituberculatus]|uniref:Uncharacterized protein n=1 Tax=Portunus trituberculatus TaxID=210409 RepID=A0A5B7HF13_PORTR|nr:hypothetical protein [Portunus trituberculatus]